MKLEIARDGVTKMNKAVYRFVLIEYPLPLPWEWNQITAFISYEKSLGNPLEIICEDKDTLSKTLAAADSLDGSEYIPPVKEAAERFVYHATDAGAAAKILQSGRLLSAAKVHGMTGEELAVLRRDTGWEDPPDFYEYIMFGWGTHLVGDYVVLSENFPAEDDFAAGNFDAGVRFYFQYNDMLRHSGHVFDGYHPMKIKDEVKLSDYLYACIVPEQYRDFISSCAPKEFARFIHYLPQRGLDLPTWNANVVTFVNSL